MSQERLPSGRLDSFSSAQNNRAQPRLLTGFNPSAIETPETRKHSMRRSVLVELDLPKDWRNFRLPQPLHQRLQELLERQDREGRLRRARRAAAALTELVDMSSLFTRPDLDLVRVGGYKQ